MIVPDYQKKKYICSVVVLHDVYGLRIVCDVNKKSIYTEVHIKTL